MSDTIPQLGIGDYVRVMQTMDMESCGLENMHGVVEEVFGKGDFQKCRVREVGGGMKRWIYSCHLMREDAPGEQP